MSLDVEAVAKQVHDALAQFGGQRVTGRMERFTFTPHTKQSDVYIEVGTVYGEVRLRVYARGSSLGRYNILHAKQVDEKVRAAVARANEAVQSQAAYRAGD